MVTFDSFKVDLVNDQWQFLKEEGPVRLWVNPNRDIMQQRLILVAPPDLPPDYPNLESQRAYFETISAQIGFAIIAVDKLAIKGTEGFSTLFKFKNPENPMGCRVLGTMMFTFDQFFCGFQFQADEHGTTGMRETMVYALLKAQNKLPPEFVEMEKQPPRMVSSMEEFFDDIKARKPMSHFSDDEEYDAMIPGHPLSRVRAYIKHLAQSIEFDEQVKQAKPFRGPAWRG